MLLTRASRTVLRKDGEQEFDRDLCLRGDLIERFLQHFGKDRHIQDEYADGLDNVPQSEDHDPHPDNDQIILAASEPDLGLAVFDWHNGRIHLEFLHTFSILYLRERDGKNKNAAETEKTGSSGSFPVPDPERKTHVTCRL